MSTSKITTVVVVALLLPILFVAATTAVLTSVLTGGPLNQGHTNGGPTDSANSTCVDAAGHTRVVAGHTAEQMKHAATIVAVGQRMNVPPQGWVIAVTAALQESGLRNLNYGDRDSLGLFQQRPSQGWGTPTQILNPTYAATQFYRHLLALPGWQHMSVNDAAQAVQRSATPTAYARHEPAARALVNAIHTTCTTPTTGPRGGACARTTDPTVLTVLRYACAQLGKPYVWGGNGEPGFDCSGLTKAAYQTAGIQLPRTAHTQYQAGPLLPAGTPPQPGDLIFFGTPQHVGHVAISLGGTAILHAPTYGQPVQISDYRSLKSLLAISRPATSIQAR